ncbi:MAG: GNAT family N-acetyltransferase [Burkholderiales bacterium]|nr:GNAT family N-acetyltransferase [Sulfuricellaceae bacterium]
MLSSALQIAAPVHHDRLTVNLARTEEEIREAQRLRYKVFAEEMGARLPKNAEGLDRDIFDPYCDHLLVRDSASGEVVGTYRLLTARQARKIGSFYSAQEFDLTRLGHLFDNVVEIGRSCVHPDFRSGGVIALLWSGLARYASENKAEYLMGCASIGMADGGHLAASLYRKLEAKNLSPVEWRVFPRNPLPLEALNNTLDAPVPPLIKGYLRAGAYVCGEPSWDPDFNTADLLILQPMKNVNSRYARHFMGGSKSSAS